MVEFARRAGFSPDELHEIATGVGEAITYVADGADQKAGFLEVSYRLSGETLEVEVRASGYRSKPSGGEEAPRTELERGLAIELMSKTMDLVDVGPAGERINLSKARRAGPSAEPQSRKPPLRIVKSDDAGASVKEPSKGGC